MNKPLLLKLLLGAPFILPHPAFCQENQTPPIENQTPSIAQKIESAQKYFQTLWQHFESQKIPMPPFAPNLLEKDLKTRFDQMMNARAQVYFTNPEDYAKKDRTGQY